MWDFTDPDWIWGFNTQVTIKSHALNISFGLAEGGVWLNHHSNVYVEVEVTSNSA